MEPLRAASAARSFAFEPTPSVEASRRHGRYVDCPVCRTDHSEYLFSNVGVRFVRCRTCAMVYVNPVTQAGPNWFDIDTIGQFHEARDRELFQESFERFLERIAARYEQIEGHPLRKTVLFGRFQRDMRDLAVAKRIGLEVVEVDDAAFRDLHERSEIEWARKHFGPDVQLVVLAETLEACSEPAAFVERLAAMLPPRAWIAATYSNAQSYPARLLRRFWPAFFDVKSCFFNTNTMTALLSRSGYVLTQQFAYPVTQTVGYLFDRISQKIPLTGLARRSPVADLKTPLRTGAHAAVFRRPPQGASASTEMLSIVFPVFNEARYVAQVIEAILAKELRIKKELVIVESNSTDGTREIVQRFQGRPGVTIVLEDKPGGKGHAVKTGLKAIKGTIVLIQDADFEYDIEDYDALLEPILQHRAAFVLGSRSLGLDDWKVRRFEGSPAKRVMLNAAQVAFAHTFNVLYQQRITDVNTMFKVFRAECLEGLDLESNGFNLDIELACKLVKNGNAPIEVPVNYVARGFEEGKKISFIRDALPSYAAFFKYRFK